MSDDQGDEPTPMDCDESPRKARNGVKEALSTAVTPPGTRPPCTGPASGGSSASKGTPRMKMSIGTPKSGTKRKLSIREREEIAEKKRLDKDEKAKQQEAARLEREDKKKQLEVEKQARRESLEKQRQEKNEEKERLRVEKEARRAQRQSEEEAKIEEKRKKDEEKRIADEEKQRRIEEKNRKEEEERQRKEKASQKFKGFFHIKQVPRDELSPKLQSIRPDTKLSSAFLPFQLKRDQYLSPIVQGFVKERFVIGAFDSTISDQTAKIQDLYLFLLRNDYVKPHAHKKLRRRLFMPKVSDEIQIIQDSTVKEEKSTKKTCKAKFLQFHENVRPAWFGTWTKKSQKVSGRRPVAKDVHFLNYDVDSEDEWEEAGPGESIKDSDSEKSQDDDNYEIDNDVFVPHGYLSGSEGEEDEAVNLDGRDMGSVLKEKELMASRNRKLKHMKPVSIGCIWQDDPKVSKATLQMLQPFKALYNFSALKKKV